MRVMHLFSSIYQRMLVWASHRHAKMYLAGVSFSEAIFFPIPVDVMLAPMAMAQLNRAWQLALLATTASALGGAISYFIGAFAFEPLVMPVIDRLDYHHYFDAVQAAFIRWDFWIIFFASFTPLPYKVFTIMAGVLGIAFFPFLIASFVGRGLRFFLVAGGALWIRRGMDKLLASWQDKAAE